MKITNTFYLFLCLILSSISHADYLDNLDNLSSHLDEKDEKTLSKLASLESRNVNGMAITPGVVQFTFGVGIPTVVCALLEITDISLQKGEHILSAQLGDAARWSVDKMVSGSGNNMIEHLVIKPLDTNLKTSLLVATNKRTYHIRLKSSTKDFMPSVNFFYPNENNLSKTNSTNNDLFNYIDDESYDDNQDAMTQTVSYSTDTADNTIPSTIQSPSKFKNYNYTFDGDPSIVPINAFDDGVNTYIQMGSDFSYQQLSIVHSITDDGSLFFSDEKLNLVNYTVNDNTYVIDGIYPHLRLSINDNNISVDIKRVG